MVLVRKQKCAHGVKRPLDTPHRNWVHAWYMIETDWLEALESLTKSTVTHDDAGVAAALVRLTAKSLKPVARRSVSVRQIAAIYARDFYHCRYCGNAVILTPVMRLFARQYPEVLPYHRNWKAGMTHPAFMALSATLDHVDPIAFGGALSDPKNLVCACWTCNAKKSDLSLAAIRWELQPQQPTDWDGLSGAYRTLWEIAGTPVLGPNEREWMSAIDALTA